LMKSRVWLLAAEWRQPARIEDGVGIVRFWTEKPY
jgi:hypothetical protein